MLRKYLNSKIVVIEAPSACGLDDEEMIVIQTENLGNDKIIVEKVERQAIFDLISIGNVMTNKEPPKQSAKNEDKISEYAEVIINNDPFGKYSGHKLGEIFEKGDRAWVVNCLKSMKNEYIKDRVRYIAEYLEWV